MCRPEKPRCSKPIFYHGLLGVAAGLTLVWAGHERHQKGWRYISQVLIGGGVTVLYLSIYAAFAYYHLIDQRSAFIILAIVVAEAHFLAMAYNAPAIAVLALAGGFLVPILLSTGRDQYRVLFTYIAILDLGMLGVVVARRWRWLGSIAYVGTQWLFWAWHTEHYHPEKRLAALFFQLIIFLIFVLADLAPNLRHEAAGWEELIRLVVNPFVFYATWYSLLNDDNHIWMATLAVALAIVYTGLARFQMELSPADRRVLLVLLAIALTFVTIAIPVQLKSNWIAMAWSVEALLLLWASFRVHADLLRWFSVAGFVLALGRFVLVDTPWSYRAPFTPVFNRYFLGALVLIACLACAAYLCRRAEADDEFSLWQPLPLAFAAFGVLLLSSSVEAYSYFAARAATVRVDSATDAMETARRLLWAAKLSLSLLWSIYAGLLMAAGFRLRLRPLRVAGLWLFGITLAKVALVDTAELRQFYRIIALLVLGLVLLTVAWAYQRIPHEEEVQ